MAPKAAIQKLVSPQQSAAADGSAGTFGFGIWSKS